jgi:hypothetical protein
MREEEDISERIGQSKHWEEFFRKTEWKRKVSRKWQKRNPGWEEMWQEPEGLLPGEREWIEGQDSLWEKIRRSRKKEEQNQREMWEKLPEEYRRKSKEFWLSIQETEEEKEARKEKKGRRGFIEDKKWKIDGRNIKKNV